MEWTCGRLLYYDGADTPTIKLTHPHTQCADTLLAVGFLQKS